MLKALIVEDEKNGREILVKLIKKYCKNILIVGSCENVEEAVELIHEFKPHILFLDIILGNTKSFDIFKLINTQTYKFQVIFTTAHEKYALRAIKNFAFDYLLKPIDKNELISTVHRLENHIHDNQNKVSDQLIIPKIKLVTRGGFDLCDIDKIIYCRSEINYTRFYLKGRKTILVSKTLKHYQVILEQFWFQRIHKSHIINLKEITQYRSLNGGIVSMSNGEILEVGKVYKDALLEKLNNNI